MRANLTVLPAACEVEVWVVRHGERIDETNDERARDWFERTPRDRQFDPELTPAGRVQAAAAAATLTRLVSRSRAPSPERATGTDEPAAAPLFDVVFTSPMQRCLATADEISRILAPPGGVKVGEIEIQLKSSFRQYSASMPQMWHPEVIPAHAM
jgi:broad specificity phosphatase PhoE